MSDKKGEGSGTKDACYKKVKASAKVWPSAYASGRLVQCRKKGAANYGNKSESFEIDPKKHNAAKKDQKIRNMMKSPNENEAKVAAKKAKGPKLMGEELNIDLAVDYFYTEGINEDGLDMIIEETGLEKFVEFVEYLTDIEVLTEARAAKRARKGGKSYEQVKAEIDAKEKAKAAKREISVDKTKKATTTAKAKQPVEKKPVRDAIARGVFRAVDAYKKGMDRHNAAMATAKKAGKVAGKAAGEFAKGAGEGVKTAGKAAKVAYKVATKEEVEEGYRVVSTSFKSGDGNPKDDVTVKRQKKVVSGDNLTKKGAERSANARRQEYGTGDAFQVQKTKTAKKRPSNAASEAEVKAKIDAKEKTQKKSRAQQSIDGMNRAGTPSGKVAAARLKADKKFNMEGFIPIGIDKENKMYRRAGNLARTSLASKGKNKIKTAKKSATIVSAITRQKENERFAKMADEKARSNYNEEIVQSILEKCWSGYTQKGMKKKGNRMVPNCVPVSKEEFELDERTRYAKETGKDPQTGKASVKGGKEPEPAMKAVRGMVKQTGGLMSSRGKAIPIPGKKKVKGVKLNFKTGPTPVDKIKAKLAKQRAPKPEIGSRFD